MLAVVLLAVLCGQQVFGAATASTAATQMPDMHEIMEMCMTETGTSMDDVLSWADGGDASENTKCQMKCVLMKANMMTNSGHFNVENMIASLPAEQHAIARECAMIEQGGDLCDLAYRNQMCMRDKSPDFYADHIKMMATAAPAPSK
ncbi:general odorant-binding protein 56h-like [Thrips palmi]|uniref:General odorant-binding protein 56h-like n=1 Tax=Thrips palmi TaxID=161013 RepID=A0A6P8XZ33_THRPL|nr:general odorant-binding protein 56h-like [Thrips palmi]